MRNEGTNYAVLRCGAVNGVGRCSSAGQCSGMERCMGVGIEEEERGAGNGGAGAVDGCVGNSGARQ